MGSFPSLCSLSSTSSTLWLTLVWCSLVCAQAAARVRALPTSCGWQSEGLGKSFDLSEILNPELWTGGCWGQAMALDVAQVGRPSSAGQPESPVGPLGQRGRGPAGAAAPLPELSQQRRPLQAGEALRLGQTSPRTFACHWRVAVGLRFVTPCLKTRESAVCLCLRAGSEA